MQTRVSESTWVSLKISRARFGACKSVSCIISRTDRPLIERCQAKNQRDCTDAKSTTDGTVIISA